MLIQLNEESITCNKFLFLNRAIVPIFQKIFSVEIPNLGGLRDEMQLSEYRFLAQLRSRHNSQITVKAIQSSSDRYCKAHIATIW